MKKILSLPVVVLLLFSAAPNASQATLFFSDYFTNSSTINQPVVDPTTNSSSYQSMVGIAGGSQSIDSSGLSLAFPVSSGVVGEFCGLFASNSTPVALAAPNDFIALTVVFVDASNILGGVDTANATLNVGLYNSGGVAPNQGHIVLNTGTSSGGTEDWIGYIARIFLTPGNSSMLTRPAQTPNGTSSQNQDLLFSNASSSQAFNNPAGAGVGSNTSPSGATLTNGAVYTIHLVITLTGVNTLSISNALYAGAGTTGTPLASQIKTASGGTFLTSAFNAMALGWRNTSGNQGSAILVQSIEVSGTATAVTGPPNIDTQPANLSVASGGSGAFFVVASGFGMSYQWHRNGTNLVDGGNISGATSDLLAISPASAADVSSTYNVTITGTGGFTTNSSNASLGLRTAANLTWNGSLGNNVWDLNTTTPWLDPGSSPVTFNDGDSVTFNDSAAVRQVNVGGRYLGATTVTVDNSAATYTFLAASTGSFAGAGQLIYKGENLFTIANVNTYTGGTIISNAFAYMFVQNLNGLGTGPVTFAKAGGTMEITPSGSTTVGIPGDLNVQDDFNIVFNTPGTFSGVFFGNLSGASGKTLTFNQSSTNSTSANQRVRLYGANTTYNGDLLLNSAVISFAPYLPNGSQTYNGTISGLGGIIQRGNGTTILNGQNTYSGGTTPTTGAIGFGSDSVGAVTSGPIGTGPLLVAPEVANTTGSGTVFAFGGARSIANPVQYPSGTNNQTLIVGGTNALTFTGAVTLNGTDGSTTFTNRIWQITNTALTTLSGVVSGTGCGLIKTGPGILVLAATETYNGSTAVSNGTLRVNGQLDVGAVTVVSNATLGGTGTILGPVTVLANGVLSPGASVGTLTINNNLTLNGNVFIEVNKSLTPSNDLTSVSGTLTSSGTGTVTVTNLGPALVAGNTFKIFNKAVANGATMTITGGGTGVGWNNNLAVDGSISVAAVVTTPPLITSVSLGANSVTLVGTNGAAGATYYVLTSTSVATSLGSWTRVATNTFGTGGSFSVTVPANTSDATRFYALQVP